VPQGAYFRAQNEQSRLIQADDLALARRAGDLDSEKGIVLNVERTRLGRTRWRLGPRHGPADIGNAALIDALADAGVRQRLAEIGQEIFPRESRLHGRLPNCKSRD